MDFSFFLLAEPAACSLFQLVFQLRIELGVFNRCGAVDGVLHFYADEAAAAAAVGQ